MRRTTLAPRDNWQQIVEKQGLYYHTIDDAPYWDESVYYSFDAGELDPLEKATYACNEMCLAAVQHVIDNRLFDRFLIPPAFVDFVVKSWETEEQSIYGRFDFCCQPSQPPKLLEYNADTPTALLEASVIQWFWLKDRFPTAIQFNSIHERLLEVFQAIRGQGLPRFHFAATKGHLEDYMTVQYLRDVAAQAGYGEAGATYLDIEEIGWNERRRTFTDLQERSLSAIFKLYPWEWMIREQFGPHLVEGRTRWFEPAWKILLSNKSLLPLLWQLFGADPEKSAYLLPAFWSEEDLKQHLGPSASFVKKPILSREGCNITVVEGGRIVAETGGPYGTGPFVWQQLHRLPNFDGRFPVLGSWLVNGWACGMGIREDTTPITGNTSRFVPHVLAQ
jgi:glutathionylspermidine synthase